MCNSNPWLIAGTVQEASDKCITLEEDDPDIIDRVLCYLYTTDYMDVEDESLMDFLIKDADSANESLTSQPEIDADEPLDKKRLTQYALMVNTRVYAAADKLDIPELKELAHEKFLSRLQSDAWPFHNFHGGRYAGSTCTRVWKVLTLSSPNSCPRSHTLNTDWRQAPPRDHSKGVRQ